MIEKTNHPKLKASGDGSLRCGTPSMSSDVRGMSEAASLRLRVAIVEEVPGG